MNMIEDDAGAAFDVAYAGDLAAAADAVNVITAREGRDIDRAARMWMDRCINTAGLARDTGVNLRVDMVSDHSPTGLPEPPQQVPVDARWAAGLFAAYLQDDDDDARVHLWAGVPDEQLHRYVLRLLTTMALTVRAYHEDGDDVAEEPGTCHCCDGFQMWLHANRRDVGAAVAKAHRN